jgi:precorrin-6B methylase 2
MRNAIRVALKVIVGRHPDAFKTALLEARPTWFVQELGKWENQSWDKFDCQDEIKGFEDLIPLFSIGRFNRGIIRLDLDEAVLLYKTVLSLGCSEGLEVGRGWGGSTLLLASAVGEGGQVTSLELTPSRDERLSQVLAKAGLAHRVRLLVGDSRTIHIGARKLDWVFIDGAREYDVARSDHERWGRLVREGGYIMHHDTTDSRPGATCGPELLGLRNEILSYQSSIVEKCSESGSLIVFRRLSGAWKPLPPIESTIKDLAVSCPR